jgi:hypothetical protein
VKKISLKETSSSLRDLIRDEAVETFHGSMVTAQGTLVLLFSPRLNKDFSLLIDTQDMSQVLSQVYEVLAQSVKEEVV